jgi:pyrroloquinoline quinone biosynthesis protein E
VVPDYYALRPKKCMGGWGRQFFNISRGKSPAMPRRRVDHRAGIRKRAIEPFHRLDLAELEAFNRYRGTGWMKEPCKSCEFRKSISAAAAARHLP